MLCPERLSGNAHTHDAGLLFTLSKVSLSFHPRSRAGWDFGAPQSDSCSAHAPRALSLPASALLTSHVATLG